MALLGSLSLAALLPAAEPVTAKHGPWELQINPASGSWLNLTWNGEALTALNDPDAATLDLKLDQEKWLAASGPYRLVKHVWDEAAAALTLTLQSGDWELQEIVQFGALGNPDRLSRRVSFTYRPAAGEKAEPAKFFGLSLKTYLPKTGKYLIPAGVFANEARGECAALEEGRHLAGWWGVWPLLVESIPGRTLLFISDGRRDRTSLGLKTQGDRLNVAPAFTAQGWAEPGVTQTLDTTYLEVHRADLDQTLREAVWKWYDDLGLKVPADRPDWVFDAALYSFHPGGTTGSGWRDLGGFTAAREELLPRIAKLGFGAVWILPVEDRSSYWPRDYYKLADGLGSPEEYKELVRAAHAADLKVWQDNVPHGGSPAFGQIRGNNPLWLAFDESGDALNYWCWDFAAPEWQAYIRGVAAHYVRDFDVDGYRIDACGGSKIVNWRRRGFPTLDRVPKNVPADWWRESLQAAGGVMPPLPYERGSLAVRQGGMQMIHGIREEVKKQKPREGAILAEVQFPPYMQETDVIYDFLFAHSAVPKFCELPPAEYVAGLSRWLEEQKLAEPRGTLRLRYVESHDSLRSRGWVGVDATRALTAVSFWIHGMPMIYQDADVGDGYYLRRLNEVRRALPEMRRGEAFYQAVTVEPGTVFAVLRTHENLASIGLVNLSPAAGPATVKLPTAQLSALGDRQFALWNAWNGEKLAEGRPAELAEVKLELAPWATAVLAFRPAGEACPVTAPEAPQAAPAAPGAGALVLNETDTAVTVSGGAYRLVVDRRTGLPQSFANAAGQELLSAGDLLLDARPAGETAATVTAERAGAEMLIRAKLPLGAKGAAELLYRCTPVETRLEAALNGEIPDARAGLVLAAPKAARYQIDTAEGRLEDWFAPRHEHGQISFGGIYYRRQGTPVIWQAETQPLALQSPAIRVYDEAGAGVELAVADPLAGGPANIQLLDKLGDQPGWRAVFLWRQPGPLTEKPATGERFALILRPAGTPAELSAAALETSGVKISNESRGWVVENAHYRVRLQRGGGNLGEIWSLAGEPRLVLGRQEIYTDKGFINKSLRASNANDGETGVRIWREQDGLHLRFCAQIRGSYRFDLLRPAMWAVTEYAFDSSPSFRTSWSVFCEGGVVTDQAFLAWIAHSPEWKSVSFNQGGAELSRGEFAAGRRTGETANLPGKPGPDSLLLRDAAGRTMLSLTELKLQSPEPLHNLFTHGDTLFLAWLDTGDRQVHARQWYRASLAVTAGDVAPGAAPAIAWPADPTEPVVDDPSFETGGAAGLLNGGRAAALPTPEARPGMWNWPRESQVDLTTAHTGEASVRFNQETPGNPYIQQYLQPGALTAGKYRLSVWAKGENLTGGGQTAKPLRVELSYKDQAGKEQRAQAESALSGTFDWQKVETEFAVPAGGGNEPRLRLGLNEAAGTLWLDEVQLEKLP